MPALWERVSQAGTVPHFPDRTDARFAQITNLIAEMVLVLGAIYMAAAFAIPALDLRRDPILFAVILSFILPWWLVRVGRVRAGGALVLVMFWICATALCVTNGGIRAPSASMYLVFVIAAGLMSRGRLLGVVIAISILSLFGLFELGRRGILPLPMHPPTAPGRAAALGLHLLCLALMVRATLRQLDEALAHVEAENEARKQTEAALRRTESELRALNVQLEARVDARTRELAAAKEDALLASREKSNFLATMSHELRTPIAGIVGLAELLAQGPLAKEQQVQLEILTSSTRTLLALLNDVLDYSKIEAGQLAIERLGFDLLSHVHDVLALLRPQAEKKQLRLALEVAADVPRCVTSDPTRLQQVLFNLVGNAIKFTPAGEVVVSLARSDNPSGVYFSVRDTGIGMPPDVISRLFSPFMQADFSTTRRYGGTGLGLAISRRLVELLGGELSVVSEPGSGSTFSFRIHAPPGQMPGNEPAVAAGAQRSLRLLLAEDNEVNAFVLTRLLSKLGHTCDRVTDGEQAVARAAAQSYDAIVMDMQMPVLDGAEATRRIRSLPGKAGTIPIVALTADAVTEHRGQYVNQGLSAFLTKPCSAAQLADVLTAVTSRKG